MTTPLDEKAVAAAHEAYAKTTGGMLDGQPMENAIRAYLSTTPADGLEVVAWECTDLIMGLGAPSVITDVDHAGARKRQPNAWLVEELVRRSQAQSALAAVREERDEAMALVNYAEDVSTTIIARAETAEAEVKRLTEANEQLKAAIATPEAVHANMLRGGIPKLSIRQALHLHGAEALEKWDDIETAEARIKALEEDRWKAINLLDAIIQGYPNPNINHEDFRAQVTVWAEELRATLNSREKVE